MQTYNETKSKEAAPKRVKLEQIIEHGRASAVSAIDRVLSTVPTDRVVKAGALDFHGDSQGLRVSYGGGSSSSIHKNAFSQLAERANIPNEYAQRLQNEGAWGSALLADNFRTLYKHQDKARYLTRTVGDELRGFLSNRFRRIDSRPIIEALATESRAVGAVPVEGIYTDTRVALRILLPRVFEPVPGEFVAFGLDWQNSDYGNGAHTLREFLLRIWCDNGATVADTLREVHLGVRLEEGEEWSNRTYKLDTDRSISMVRDAVKNQLTPGKIDSRMRQYPGGFREQARPEGVGHQAQEDAGRRARQGGDRGLLLRRRRDAAPGPEPVAHVERALLAGRQGGHRRREAHRAEPRRGRGAPDHEEGGVATQAA